MGIPVPADMSVRIIPGWTENVRILGLSMKLPQSAATSYLEWLRKDVPA